MKIKKLIFSVASLLAIFFFVGSLCQPNPIEEPPADNPDYWDNIKNCEFPNLWVKPDSRWSSKYNELLPYPINSIAWEDSSFVTGNGEELYFANFKGDAMRWLFGKDKYLRANVPDLPEGRWDPCDWSQNVIIAERNANGTWTDPQMRLWECSESCQIENQVVIDNEEVFYYCGQNDGDISTVDLYGQVTECCISLPQPPNSSRFDSDPDTKYISETGKTVMFFTQHDAGTNPENREIYVTERQSSGIWNTAIKLSPPINTGDGVRWQWQPFLFIDGTEKYLYFSTMDKIMASKWPDGVSFEWPYDSWGEPVTIVSVAEEQVGEGTQFWAIGEPAITADGEELYFVVAFVDDRPGWENANYDCDIAWIRRKGGNGDLDWDKDVDLNDVNRAVDIVLDRVIPNSYENWAGDMDDDGDIDLFDILEIVDLI